MSARDELTTLILGRTAPSAADKVLAAGYRKPRIITTTEELDSLPVGSVVLSDAYRYMVHGGADCGWPIAFQRWDDKLWHRGARSGDTHPDNFLPATVLHEPEVKL
ncbi:hypothetical protein SEA_EVEPICKLES_44 [Arthrobacter phage EvePickles]|nr:hypothetical protein SEA_EVEPICKLES_44 [Arthrobacter phage EvePickles]